MSKVSAEQEHLTGCHCKRSACLKKYCECYTAQVACSDRCRCIDCRNTAEARNGINFIPSTITKAYMQDSAEVDAKIREAALLKRKAGDKISGSSCDKNTYSNGGGPSVEGEGGSGEDDEKSSVSAASESRTKMHLHPQIPKALLLQQQQQQQQQELTPSINNAMKEMDMKYEQEDD